MTWDKAKVHRVASFVKSGVRIIGYLLLPVDLGFAGAVLVFAEIIGIAEEVWGS